MPIENFGHGLHRVVYVSRMVEMSEEQLKQEADEIIDASRRRNAAQALTGLLLAHEGFFIQALEGSHDALVAVMDQIAADPRHCDIKVVGVEPITERAFGRWSMRGGASKSDSGFDPYAMTLADLMALLRVSAVMGARRSAA